MNLGRALRLMRTASGMKQKEIADRLGVTANYISLLENGKREPSVAFLKGLAKILGIPVGLFFLWDEAEVGASKKSIDQLRDMLGRLESMYLFANRRRSGKRRTAA